MRTLVHLQSSHPILNWRYSLDTCFVRGIDTMRLRSPCLKRLMTEVPTVSTS